MNRGGAMDATGRGLLRAIVAEPGDDTPRLAYADWLDENDGDGAVMAAFIRRQCAAGYTPDWGDGDGSGQLTVEQHAHRILAPAGFRLLGWDEGQWVCYTPDDGDSTVRRVDVQFTRGFASHVQTSAEMWLKVADGLVWHPSQTVRCEACWHLGQQWYDCRACGNTGTVPRPCPATAQPLTDVTLTTEPPWGRGGWPEFPDGHRLAATAVTLQRWPGVTFHLPTHATVSTTTDEPGPDVPHDPRLVLGTPDAPVFETPPEPEIPLDGWRFTRRVRPELVAPDENPLAALYASVEEGELKWQGGAFGVTPPRLTGRQFGPVDALDADGYLWRCDSAIIHRASISAGARDTFGLELDAVTSGPFRRLG